MMVATLRKPPKKALKRPDTRQKYKKRRETVLKGQDIENILSQVPLTQVQAELCRKNFFYFVKLFWNVVVKEKPVWNWHIEFLCEELQMMAERVFEGLPKEHDLIVNISPGTTKSTIFSVMFPAWVWIRMSTARVLVCSYAFTLASGFARKSRDIIQSELYHNLFPDIKIRDDQNAKHHYVNTEGGERFATGCNGVVLGMHFHFIIVDDPISPQDANSELKIQSTNAWMDETLPSRVVDKELTPTIIVMQRLHENDPTGARLAQSHLMPVRHICLPAELNEDVKPEYVRELYVDGLMDHVRLGHRSLVIAEAKGDYYYSSQFLQSPIPRGTAMFLVKKLGKGNPPKMLRVVRFWDKACLRKGTLVSTARGQVPIEEVVEGDLVSTRLGYRRVVWSGVTRFTKELYRLTCVDGSEVVGTFDHPIWTVNRGWVSLAELVGSSYDPITLPLEELWEGQGIGNSRVSSFKADTTHGRRTSGTTAGRKESLIRSRVSGSQSNGNSTETCGKVSTARSRKALISTTRITTQTTTTRATSYLSASLTMPSFTTPSRSGTRPRGQTNSEPKTGGRLLKCSPPETPCAGNALFVGQSFSPNTPTSSGLSFAQNYVEADTVMNEEGRRSKVISVHRIPSQEAEWVYDLEVEEAHEFYANGVLVHNCTSGGGAFTVGTKMGLGEDGRYWVLDVIRVQVDSGTREMLIKATARADGRAVRIGIEEEPGSGGKHSASFSVAALAGFIATAIKVGKSDGDKEARADAYSSQVNVGNVSLVEATWNHDYVHELKFFPRSKYKDQVDSSSGAFNMLVTKVITIGGASLLNMAI